jgi:hypothetical protein
LKDQQGCTFLLPSIENVSCKKVQGSWTTDIIMDFHEVWLADMTFVSEVLENRFLERQM